MINKLKSSDLNQIFFITIFIFKQYNLLILIFVSWILLKLLITMVNSNTFFGEKNIFDLLKTQVGLLNPKPPILTITVIQLMHKLKKMLIFSQIHNVG